MDVPNETVVLVEESSTLQLPNDAACWAFYRTGKDQIGVSAFSILLSCQFNLQLCSVFIYSCPSGSPVKSRMLFSSNTQPIAAKARSLGLEISKKVSSRSQYRDARIANQGHS